MLLLTEPSRLQQLVRDFWSFSRGKINNKCDKSQCSPIKVLFLQDFKNVYCYNDTLVIKCYDDDLMDDLNKQSERKSLSVRANMLSRRFLRNTPAVEITFFRAYCIPTG